MSHPVSLTTLIACVREVWTPWELWAELRRPAELAVEIDGAMSGLILTLRAAMAATEIEADEIDVNCLCGRRHVVSLRRCVAFPDLEMSWPGELGQGVLKEKVSVREREDETE